MSELKINQWNPDTEEVTEVAMDLEQVIRNPAGLKLEDLGLFLFNIERTKRGLSRYVKNPLTGIFDEEISQTIH